jgi:hypothetical protein
VIPTRNMKARLGELERTRAPVPNLLAHATDAELDRLERLATRREMGVATPAETMEEQAIHDACARRQAEGAPPWEESVAGHEARDMERAVYWGEVLPNARRTGKPINYESLDVEARRIAAARLHGKR